MKDIALVYIVAGNSNRFGGEIKQFAKITKRETLIEYSLKQALPAGFSKIIFVVGNKTEMPFKEKFGEEYEGIPIEYVSQAYDESERDRPWGTGDALCAIKKVIDGPFVVCNGDDIYGGNTFQVLFNHLQKSDHHASIGYRLERVIPREGKVNRGIFYSDSDGYVIGIKEKFEVSKNNLFFHGLSKDSLCSMNIFALFPEAIDLLAEEMEKFKEEHQGDRQIEFILTDELSKFIESGKIRMKLYPTTDRWFGVTNPGDEEIIKRDLEMCF
jgi:NDP-sugar pyrophosphorylase family protein